jgi:hypothetical protein
MDAAGGSASLSTSGICGICGGTLRFSRGQSLLSANLKTRVLFFSEKTMLKQRDKIMTRFQSLTGS